MWGGDRHARDARSAGWSVYATDAEHGGDRSPRGTSAGDAVTASDHGRRPDGGRGDPVGRPGLGRLQPLLLPPRPVRRRVVDDPERRPPRRALRRAAPRGSRHLGAEGRHLVVHAGRGTRAVRWVVDRALRRGGRGRARRAPARSTGTSSTWSRGRPARRANRRVCCRGALDGCGAAFDPASGASSVGPVARDRHATRSRRGHAVRRRGNAGRCDVGRTRPVRRRPALDAEPLGRGRGGTRAGAARSRGATSRRWTRARPRPTSIRPCP